MSVARKTNDGNKVEPTHTADGRYIVVDGRRWRATDRSIPERLKAELVGELMAARREIRVHRDRPELVQQARARVNDAKHALGERGEPWWDQPTEAAFDNRIRSTIRALTAKRGPEKSICPSEVARVVASPDWRPAMDRVRTVAKELAGTGEVVITSSGNPVAEIDDHVGPIRIGARSAC